MWSQLVIVQIQWNSRPMKKWEINIFFSSNEMKYTFTVIASCSVCVWLILLWLYVETDWITLNECTLKKREFSVSFIMIKYLQFIIKKNWLYIHWCLLAIIPGHLCLSIGLNYEINFYQLVCTFVRHSMKHLFWNSFSYSCTIKILKKICPWTS